MSTNLSEISVKDLKKAIKIKARLEALQSKLEALFGSSGPVAGTVRRGVRRMSAAGRRAIAAAQKLRWSKHGKKKGKPGRKAKRTMSAAARAKISRAAKLRWKKVKALGGNRL